MSLAVRRRTNHAITRDIRRYLELASRLLFYGLPGVLARSEVAL